ncbi:MAG: secondary thiamine-phosphate synthase enzyme YjbQ [Bacteroidales bacterium]|nr:secondary thiamine-phosphate synthase enzyme YjbQ [Bacteroidales bacterium]
MIDQFEITLPAFHRGFHLITQYVEKQLPPLPEKGLLHLFLQHTSAGLTINENVDSTVRYDFETIMNRIVPESRQYAHNLEGMDDMPAHVKSSLVGQSLTIPVTHGRMNMGTWQGIYLCEFRNHGGPRRLVMTVFS